MKIVSNEEFKKLVEGKPRRLVSMAKDRYEKNPTGFLTLSDLDEIRKAVRYSGDPKSLNWLNSLRTLATSGKIQKIRRGQETAEDHINEVHRLYAQNKIPFDIDDSVMIKETGKRGKVIDYVPSTDEFIVVLNPFQWKQYPSKELQKMARKV